MRTTRIPSSDPGHGRRERVTSRPPTRGPGHPACVTSRPPTRSTGHIRVLLLVLGVRILVFLVVLAVLAVRVREDDPQQEPCASEEEYEHDDPREQRGLSPSEPQVHDHVDEDEDDAENTAELRCQAVLVEQENDAGDERNEDKPVKPVPSDTEREHAAVHDRNVFEKDEASDYQHHKADKKQKHVVVFSEEFHISVPLKSMFISYHRSFLLPMRVERHVSGQLDRSVRGDLLAALLLCVPAVEDLGRSLFSLSDTFLIFITLSSFTYLSQHDHPDHKGIITQKYLCC